MSFFSVCVLSPVNCVIILSPLKIWVYMILMLSEIFWVCNFVFSLKKVIRKNKNPICFLFFLFLCCTIRSWFHERSRTVSPQLKYNNAQWYTLFHTQHFLSTTLRYFFCFLTPGRRSQFTWTFHAQYEVYCAWTSKIKWSPVCKRKRKVAHKKIQLISWWY